MSSSVVSLQVGQCGIQLGTSLLETIAGEEVGISPEGGLSGTFFRQPLR